MAKKKAKVESYSFDDLYPGWIDGELDAGNESNSVDEQKGGDSDNANNPCTQVAMGDYGRNHPGWADYLERFKPTISPIIGANGEVVGHKITPPNPEMHLEDVLMDHRARYDDW